MRPFFVLFFIIYIGSSGAQTTSRYPDSLQHILASPNADGIKLKALNKLSNYFQFKRPKTARMFEDSGLSMSLRIHSDTDACTFYGYIGENFLNQGLFDDAVKSISAQYSLASKTGHKLQMASALSDLGLIAEMQGDYLKAQDYFFKCLRIAEEIRHKVLMAICNTNICVVYLNQNNYDKTIEYAQKVLDFAEPNNRTALVAKAVEMIGTANAGKKNFTEAQKYYNKGLAIYQGENDRIGIATITSLLATTYRNNNDKKLSLALDAQHTWDSLAPEDLYSINNLGTIGTTYGDMARNAASGNQTLYKKAEDYLKRALALANKTNSKQNIVDLTDSLSVLQATLGDYHNAYSNLRKHNVVNDSLFSQETKNKIASLEGKHEIELRDKQIEINKLQLHDEQKQKWFFVIGLLLVVLIALLIYARSRQRQKTNQILQNLNTQLNDANNVKTTFFNIINHDLRRPIAGFLDYLYLQQEGIDIDEQTRAAYVAKTTTSAENLLEAMDDLLLWSKGQMDNFKPSINTFEAGFFFDYLKKSSGPALQTKLQFNVPAIFTLTTDEHYFKTILHNLTNNAIKALNNSPNGLITWDAWKEDGRTYLSITDNGPGISEAQLRPLYDASAPMGIKNGLGLHIVRDMCKAIGCKIWADSTYTNGAKIILQL